MSSCLRCRKSLGDGDRQTSYLIVYDKCRGKTCPDCGKVRKMGWYKTYQNSAEDFPCVRCKRRTSSLTNNVCGECFFERERKRGCVCFATSGYDEDKGHHDNINYYCPLCEDIHPRESLCKECFEKQMNIYQRRQTFLKVILPTAFVSLVIGFFLGWLFFKKLWKKKRLNS